MESPLQRHQTDVGVVKICDFRDE